MKKHFKILTGLFSMLFCISTMYAAEEPESPPKNQAQISLFHNKTNQPVSLRYFDKSEGQWISRTVGPAAVALDKPRGLHNFIFTLEQAGITQKQTIYIDTLKKENVGTIKFVCTAFFVQNRNEWLIKAEATLLIPIPDTKRRRKFSQTIGFYQKEKPNLIGYNITIIFDNLNSNLELGASVE